MYQNDIRFCFLDDGEEVTAGLFVDYGKLMLLFCWHYFVLCPKCYITSCCWVTVPGAPSSVSPDLSPSCSVSVLSSSSFSGSRVSSSSPNHGSHRGHVHSSARNTFISPKPRDGLGDPKHQKWGVNDDLARWGVWWAGIPSVVTTSNLSPGTQVPPPVPHWLITMGWTTFLDVTQVYSLPLFQLAPPRHLVSSFLVHLFLFLCVEFTIRMSPHKNPRHPTLPLFTQTFLTVTTPASC